MLVRNLERQECLEFLKQIGFGRLGCVKKNQPYVVPIYFAYESEQLFGFSTEGIQPYNIPYFFYKKWIA
jgi:uncharacterized protein